MGEVHGVAENPLIVADLVAELGVEVVALEWRGRYGLRLLEGEAPR